MTGRWPKASLVFVAGSLASASACAGEFPAIGGVLTFELQNDATIESDDPSLEISDGYATIEAEVAVRFAEPLALNIGIVAEPIRDPGPFEDRFLEDEGVYVETLFLEYATETFSVLGGKINPRFGVASDQAPGLYGADFADDYELTERIGFGGTVTLGDGSAGVHTLGASAFFADTTLLSESVIENRGDLDRSDAGPSNTGDPASFAVTLDGGDLPSLPGLAYQLAISHQEKGRGDAANETGYVLALYGAFALSDGLVIAPLVEVVRQENDEAGPDDATYVTVGAALTHGPWTLALAGTLRSIDVAGGPDGDDSLLQVSVGYASEIGIGVDVGYKAVEEGGIDSDVIGALVSYEVEF